MEQLAGGTAFLCDAPAVAGSTRLWQDDLKLVAYLRGDDFAIGLLVVLHGIRVFLAETRSLAYVRALRGIVPDVLG